MKYSFLGFLIYPLLALSGCHPPERQSPEFDSVSKVEKGTAVSVMLTAYSTTLIADGKDHTVLRVAITDSLSREITSANDSIRLYLSGDAIITHPDGRVIELKVDTAGKKYVEGRLEKGTCRMVLVAGMKPDKIKIEVKCGRLWPGGHEIHTVPATFEQMKPDMGKIEPTIKPIDRMIGADISFLPQLEESGGRFYDIGKQTDAISLLKAKGFNYIRLRIFMDPSSEKGYAPGKGFCDLDHTLAMARRIKAEGMKLLLDFHYSDYWADPQQQYKPAAWETLDIQALKDSVHAYTSRVILALTKQGTPVAMVQVGNEINHGFLWPDGHISHPDQLAELLKAGVQGVESADATIPVMMHIALGGQHDEAIFWLDNMIARGVRFDVIGLSYYPRWHGTLEDLKSNLTDLAIRYKKPLNVVEYSDFKKEVHEIVFNLPDGLGKGACIWEPLNQRSGLFDKDGNTTGLFGVYEELNAEYISNK